MTEIGIIGDAPAFRVSRGGAVTGLAGADIASWWVGAEDRWHRADEEVASRQSLGSDGASVETRLKIPGGDVVARVVAAPVGSSGAVVLEVVNETPVPVAFALVVHGENFEVYEDLVRSAGRPIVRADRAVARVSSGESTAALAAAVEGGEAIPPSELTGAIAGSVLAAIFPLPHTARLRFAIATGGSGPDVIPAIDSLPSVTDVGRGWERHLEGGMRVVLADERAHRGVDAARRHLLVGSAQPLSSAYWSVEVEPWAPALCSVALTMWGHISDGRELLLSSTAGDGPFSDAGRPLSATASLLWAWAELLHREPDAALVERLRPWVVDRVGDLLSSVSRRKRRKPSASSGDDAAWRAVGLAASASLLTMLDETEAGRDIVDAFEHLADDAVSGPFSVPAAIGGRRLGWVQANDVRQGDLASQKPTIEAALCGRLGLDVNGSMNAVLSAIGPTGVLARAEGGSSDGCRVRDHDPVTSALLLLVVRQMMVDEPSGLGGPISLFSGVPDNWLGTRLELHGAPVTGGTVDAGVRWHGDRPALLWDAKVGRPVEVTAPGLAPGWSDGRSSAEALLEATEGLVVEAGSESPRVRRGDEVDIDSESPESFG